jgi:hypothetical protein
MRAYGARYLGDLRAFAKAYLLALVAILPLILLTYGLVGIVAYLYLALIGGFYILTVSFLTAVWGNFAYKFLIYLGAVIAIGVGLRDVLALQPAPGIPGPTAILFAQVTFLMALFYLIAHRHEIAGRLRKYFDAES